VTVNDPNPRQVQERVIAAALISESAGRASKALDTFASWLLAGFGGAVALLLSSHEPLSLVSVTTVRAGSKLFICAVLATVIQKYLAIIVASAADGAALGRALVKEHIKERKEQGLNPMLDTEAVTSEMVKPLFWPGSWIARKFVIKAHSGDFGAGARATMKLAQIQGVFVMIEIVVFLDAAICIVRALPS